MTHNNKIQVSYINSLNQKKENLNHICEYLNDETLTKNIDENNIIGIVIKKNENQQYIQNLKIRKINTNSDEIIIETLPNEEINGILHKNLLISLDKKKISVNKNRLVIKGLYGYIKKLKSIDGGKHIILNNNNDDNNDDNIVTLEVKKITMNIDN